MNRKIYLFPLFLLVLSFVACNETEEEGKYDNWRERNEAFIDSLQQVYKSGIDPELEMVADSKDKKSKIYYKRIKRADISIVNGDTLPLAPYYNSPKVEMFYRGMYINEEVFAKGNTTHYTDLYNDPEIKVFDENFTGKDPIDKKDAPAVFAVNGVVRGWTELLQLMRPGDHFEAYIPYQSGYGEDGYLDILGYSTLIFDMRLKSIKEY